MDSFVRYTRMAKIVLLAVLFLPFFAHASETISSFDVAINLFEDSSFEVTEIITYDFDTNQRHGIFRYIPTTHPQESSSENKVRYTKVTLKDVTMDGTFVPYIQEERSDELFIKIGDPDKTISGEHTYAITYTVEGGLLFLDDTGAEIYWNVTGAQWNVPIKNIRVKISAPSGLLTETRACYAGVQGGVVPCELATVVEGNAVFTQSSLPANAGLTIGQALNRSALTQEVILEKTTTWYYWVAGILVWFIGLGIFVYKYKTAYKIDGPIIPQYEPYADFKPMYTGLLRDGRLDPSDITACIVYLAQQGYLKIAKTSSKVLFLFEVDNYEITLVKTPDEHVSDFQKEILKLLFDSITTSGVHIALSKLKSDTSKQRENLKVLQALKKELEKDLQAEGFFQVIVTTKNILIAIAVVVGLIFFFFNVVTIFLGPYSVFFGIVIVTSLGLLALLYRRRTHKGYEALNHLKGFEHFLSVTEKERYAFHNAPAKSPEQFMEFLPYAIALGVEKQWSKAFEDITIPNPDWYDAGSSATSFSAVNLTTSLGAFSTAFASSSGSSSGSSGGGSVGGGGGGGGGGSW